MRQRRWSYLISVEDRNEFRAFDEVHAGVNRIEMTKARRDGTELCTELYRYKKQVN